MPSFKRTTIRFNKLAHVTHLDAALSISKEGFKAISKNNPTDLYLVFFHAVPNQESIDKLKENLNKHHIDFLVDSVKGITVEEVARFFLPGNDSNLETFNEVVATSTPFISNVSRLGISNSRFRQKTS